MALLNVLLPVLLASLVPTMYAPPAPPTAQFVPIKNPALPASLVSQRLPKVSASTLALPSSSPAVLRDLQYARRAQPTVRNAAQQQSAISVMTASDSTLQASVFLALSLAAELVDQMSLSALPANQASFRTETPASLAQHHAHRATSSLQHLQHQQQLSARLAVKALS